MVSISKGITGFFWKQNFINNSPIPIQKSSLILVIILTDILSPGASPIVLKANIKPPSRVPNCIGEKKSMFAKRDDKPTIINAST